MANLEEPVSPTADTERAQMQAEFLRTGKVPFGQAVRHGIRSLLRDPWLTVIQNMPGPLGFVLRQRHYRRRLGAMGKGVVIGSDVRIDQPENVYLSDFVYLDLRARLESPEGYIRVGRRCHIGGWILGHAGVEIGDYVASGAAILSVTDSHQGGHRMSGPMVPIEQRHLVRGKVVIGKDAFLAQYSIIMPGVTIGDGAVVGPHSLVVRDVAPWTIVLGSPARTIGRREPVRFPDP